MGDYNHFRRLIALAISSIVAHLGAQGKGFASEPILQLQSEQCDLEHLVLDFSCTYIPSDTQVYGVVL